MPVSLSRRDALHAAAAAVATVALPSLPAAQEVVAPESNDFAERFAALTGGATPAEGRVSLDLPEIAENGNTVPLTIRVESPMTADDHVAEVVVLSDGNPNATVATFRFTPLAGRAEASTRIRLAQSQRVTALARMSDGSLHVAGRDILVTVGGCAS
jgi:sulfur-oxidizing protein SoxY